MVSVKRSYAYNKLLLLGLAEYATPEALLKVSEKSKGLKKKEEEDEERLYSGKHVLRVKFSILQFYLNYCY